MPVSSEAGKTAGIWTPANVITMIRICLVPVFVVAFLSPWPEWLGMDAVTMEVKSLIAAALFIVISCTDWLDGYLARSRGEVTDFGKFMDPLADKILVAAALLALVELQVLPSWPVLIILAREFIVSGVRMVAASKGDVIAASWLGKAKTVSQIVAIVLFIVKDVFYPSANEAGFTNPLYDVSWLVMIVALVLTVVSMMDYLVKARSLLGFGRGAEATAAAVPSTDDLQARVDAAARSLLDAAREKGVTLGTAESLTGGMACEALTAIPGSSEVVRGAVVSYAIDVKHQVLGVGERLLEECGAVDGTVASQMAEGARKALRCDVAVATTGIAGPGGAEPGKPVGTVWVGCAMAKGVHAVEHAFGGDRAQVRLQATLAALELACSALAEAPEAVRGR